MPRTKDMSRLSSKAENALSEIDTQRYDIEHQLEDLSKAELRAVAHHARKDGRVYPLWTGVAAAAEQRLELLERYRTGRGKWVALVEEVDWSPARDANLRVLARAECETRSAAVTRRKGEPKRNNHCLGFLDSVPLVNLSLSA